MNAKEKKAHDAAVRRQRKAANRAKQKAEREKAKEKAEEKLAPEAQRNPVMDANGNVVKAPRVYRFGRNYEAVSPIEYYYVLGKEREEKGKEPLIKEEHRLAAKRLVQAYEEGGVGIGQGASDYGRQPARGTTPTGYSDVLLARLEAQRKQRDLYLAAKLYMERTGLWAVTKAIVIDGIYITVWAKSVGMDRDAAVGFMAAAMKALVGFWNLVDKPKERRALIRASEFISAHGVSDYDDEETRI